MMSRERVIKKCASAVSNASMIVQMRTSLRGLWSGGALFAGVTSYHPASLATTITMTLSVAGRLSEPHADSKIVSTRHLIVRFLRAENSR